MIFFCNHTLADRMFARSARRGWFSGPGDIERADEQIGVCDVAARNRLFETHILRQSAMKKGRRKSGAF